MTKKYLRRQTRRLEIRPLTSADFEAWQAAYLKSARPKNKWDMIEHAASDLTIANFKKKLRHFEKQQKRDYFYHFGFFSRQGDLIGMGSLMEVSRGISQTAFLGYRIFNPYWGQGFAKEAVRAVIDIGFKDVKLHRIEAGVEPKNRRSVALAKSLGMRREGLKKRAVFLRKMWVDLIIFTLTTEDLGRGYSTTALRKRS